MNSLTGFGAGAARDPLSVSYRGTIEGSTGAGTGGAGNVSLGTAPVGSNTRHMLLLISSACIASTRTIDACTLGGLTATRLDHVGASNAPCAIFIVEVPTNASDALTITFSGATNFFIVAAYAIYNLPSATPYSTINDPTHASGVIVLSLNTPSGGLVFACTSTNNASTTTWVGITEAWDLDNTASDDEYASGGYAEGIAAETPRTITATNADTTPVAQTGVAACFASS